MISQDDRLLDLIGGLCNGNLPLEEERQLADLLHDEPDARRMYVRYMDVHLALADLDLAGGEVSDSLLADALADEEAAGGDFSVFPNSGDLLPLAEPDVPDGRRLGPISYFSQVGPLSYMVATVIMCLMLLGAWAYKITLTQVVDKQIKPDESRQFVFMGRITGMKDCRWAESDAGAIIGASVPLGRKFALESGLLEISYHSGAKVILEGPCEYTVDSDVSGRLQLGRLVARVEKNDELGIRNKESNGRQSGIHHSSFINHHLFAITTPTAIVTDLGTEFGVEVDNNGTTTSHVFQGVVAMRTNANDNQRVILRENESARVESHGNNRHSIVKTIDEEASRFVTKMPPASLENADAYAKLVLSYNPVVYYRMERPANDIVVNKVIDSSSNGLHAILKLGNEYGSPYHAGRWGDALWFRGPRVVDAVLVPDYPKATENKLSVSAWVTAERWMDRWPKIAANWGIRPLGQFNFGLHEDDLDLAVRVMQRDGTRLTVREGRPFPHSLWQHVAFTVDGSILRLYRNGVEVGRAECCGITPNPQVKSLAIGSKTFNDGEQIVPSYSWRGMIDELAVFNEALTPEDIRRLYAGKPLPAKKQKEVENMGNQ